MKNHNDTLGWLNKTLNLYMLQVIKLYVDRDQKQWSVCIGWFQSNDGLRLSYINEPKVPFGRRDLERRRRRKNFELNF